MPASNDPQVQKFSSVEVLRDLQVDRVLSGGAPTAITAGATPVVDASLNNVFTLTPAEDETLSCINQSAGQRLTVIVLTSGATSRTLTWGTGFKSTGTLATGVTTARYFIMSFLSDGTNMYEVSRTTAMA